MTNDAGGKPMTGACASRSACGPSATRAATPSASPTRAPLDPVDSVHQLAELGAWGVSFHDDDLSRGAPRAAERDRIVARFAGRARRDRHGRRDGDDQPVRPPGLQGRRVHVQRPRRAPRGDRQGDARRSTSAPSWAPRSTSSGAAARAPRSARPRTRATRSSATARRSTCSRDYVVEPGLRPALRDRAQAQRAARRHLPADRRPRAALHLDARPPGDGRRQPRGRARDDGGPVVPPRRRAGAVGGQALPHRPQRAADRPLRPGLPLRRRGPQGGVPARAAARARRLRRARGTSTRTPTATRTPTGVWDFAARLHAHLPRAGRARARTSTRCPRSRRRWRPRRRPSSREPSVDGAGGRRAQGRGRRASTRSPSAATATSASTSSCVEVLMGAALTAPALTLTRLRAGDTELSVAADRFLEVRSLRHRGEELLVAAADLPLGARVHGACAGITLLHPWANRLSADRYTAAGRTAELAAADGALSRDGHGSALHGLAAPAGAWRLEPADGARLHASLHHVGAGGSAFPFPHDLCVELVLRPGRLHGPHDARRRRTGRGAGRVRLASLSARPGRAARRLVARPAGPAPAGARRARACPPGRRAASARTPRRSPAGRSTTPTTACTTARCCGWALRHGASRCGSSATTPPRRSTRRPARPSCRSSP